MSNIIRKDILQFIDYEIRVNSRVPMLIAIRNLVEKFYGNNGWQERARIIRASIPLVDVKEFLEEIRDFGKEVK